MNIPTHATHSVDDGATQAGKKVTVSCRVVVDGTGYDVKGKAVLDGVGTVEVSGHFEATGAQTAVRAVFTRGDTGTFIQNDCTASYAANATMGVAAGHVWANLDCPHAAFAAQSRTCLGTAEFKFENCAQN